MQSVHLLQIVQTFRNMNKLYGFEGEVTKKCFTCCSGVVSKCFRCMTRVSFSSGRYDEELYLLFCEAFCLLPLCHVINNQAAAALPPS